MAQIIGTVAQLDGKFYLKDENGNIRELKIGDEIKENEIVIGDDLNSDTDKIIIDINGNQNTIKIVSNSQLKLDATLLDETPENDLITTTKNSLNDALENLSLEEREDILEEEQQNEVAVIPKLIDTDEEENLELEFVDRTADETDINSDLRVSNTLNSGAIQAKFHGLQESANEDFGNFVNRTGNETDINSDLRDTDTGKHDDRDENEYDNGVNNTNDDTVKIDKYIVYATLTGDTSVLEGSTAGYLISLLDIAGNPVLVTKDTIVNVTFTNSSTENADTEYVEAQVITVTILAGTSSISLDTDTVDDYIADHDEDYTLTISSIPIHEFDAIHIDGFTDTNNDVHVATKTTTILDNSKNTPNDPYDENTTNNPPVEINLDTITIKLFAIDATTGDRVPVNQVAEGSSAEYIAVAFDKDNNEVLTNETVEVTFGKTGDTATDGGTDYTSTTQTVTLGTKFSTPTTDDYISDNGEKYKVQITDETLSNAADYETVVIDTTSVTTTITDDSRGTPAIPADPSNPGDAGTPAEPHNPNTPPTPEHPETNHEIVQIKLVACDESGMPMLVDDGNGNITKYVFANEIPEDNEAYYMAIAFEPGATEYTTATKLADSDQLGSVTVSSQDLTPTVDAEAGDDYTAITTTKVDLNTVFSVDTLDDYIADDNEKYEVVIDASSYSSTNVAGTNQVGYENVSIDGKVETTIYDNSKPDTNIPHDPNEDPYTYVPGNPPSTPGNGEEDGEPVILKIVACDASGNPILEADGKTYTFTNGVAEGNDAKYMVLAFKPETTDFTTVNVVAVQGGTVTIKTADIANEATGVTAQTKNDGTQDYISQTTKEVTVGEAFDIKTLNDFVSDNNETYNVAINDGTYEHPTTPLYENVKTDIGVVTTNITDNPQEATIVLVAVDSATTTIASITDGNGKLIIDSTNSTPESGKLYYIAVAIDKTTGKPLDTQSGKVTVDYGTTTDGADKDATEDTDYVNTFTEATIGTVFEVLAKDDFYAEGDENFTVTISNPTATPYENPAVDDNNDMVTSTIQDNPANVKKPTDETNIDEPTGSYDKDDTVYVKLTKNDSVVEGNTLTHTVTLVDKDNNPITVPAGETITVTLGYSSDTTKNADFDGSTKTTTVTIIGGDSTATVSNKTIDDFTEENPNEVYTLTIIDVAQTNDTYENVTIHTQKTATGEIKDGVTLGDPIDAKVYEDGLNTSATTENDLTNSLGITNPNSDTYTVSFDKTITTTTETSNGQAITYSYNTEGTVLTATRADTEVVFTVELTKDGSGNDVYDFKLITVMDHVYGNNGKNEFDMPFKFNVTTNGTTSSNQTFNVIVVDSVPSADPITTTTKEDTAVTIRLADDDFKTGEKVTINDVQHDIGTSEIAIYEQGDATKQIGSLTINSNGTVTFTPVEDYSNHDTLKSPQFTYTVKDYDGDEASSTITINVTPVADTITITPSTPTIIEDNTNANEGAAQVDLELTKPALSKDQTDKNFASGDYPERNGEITLTFTNGDKITGAKIFESDGTTQVGNEITAANQTLKVIIINDAKTAVDYDYHHANVTIADITNPPAGTVYLTQAEYQGLKIQHAEDNDTNIKIKIGVTSYELNDSNEPLSITDADLYETTTVDMTVKINPATDDISLIWDTATGGTITQVDNTGTNGNNNASNTFTFSTQDEGYYFTNAINLKDLLTKTSGTENDTTPSGGDLDGSEKRTYTFDGIPEGSVITLGGETATAGSDGKATIVFNNTNNQAEDPIFSLKLPEYYSGSVANAKITLSVQDKGVDSDDSAGSIKTAEVYFNIEVTAVAGEATLQISQAFGNEDAARLYGNTDNTTSSNDAIAINDKANGIELEIKVTSDDTDGSEKFIVRIDDIPDDGSLYVFDQSLDSGNGEWVLVDKDFVSSGNLSIAEGTSSDTWQIVIKDFQNDELPKFIPTHNSDDDYTFKVNAQTVDDVSTWNGSWGEITDKEMDVIVKDVADVPINTDLKGFDINGNANNASGAYNVVLSEETLDNGTNKFNLTDVYQTPTTLDSYDGASETLSVVISGLDVGFGVEGASLISSGVWSFLADNIADVKITTPKNFSGEADFTLKYVTTEDAGDSKTHYTDTVTLYVRPSVDDVTTSNSTIYEDVDYTDEDGVAATNKIDLSASLNDSDGSETITAVKILASSVPTNYALYSDASFSTLLVAKTSGYYELTPTEAESVYAKNTTAHDADSTDNFDLTVVYTVQDTAKDIDGNVIVGSTITSDFTHTNAVSVKAVTDEPTLAISSIDETDTKVSVSGTTVTVADGDSEFTVNVNTTSGDDDGSETVQRIEIHGVPKGVTIEGATYQGHTGNDSGIWVIESLSDDTIDAVGALVGIKFIVEDGADFLTRDMTIKTFTKDANTEAEEETDSVNITLKSLVTSNGPGTATTPDFELVAKSPEIDEEETLTLLDFYNVSYTTGQVSGSSWAADFTGLTDGTVVEVKDGATTSIFTYVEGGQTHYVVSGSSQNASDIGNVFSTVEITPPVDMNTGGDTNGTMTISGTISSTNGAASHQGGTVVQDLIIYPITDEMTIAVNVSDINEDATSALSIDISNPKDGTKSVLVGNSITIKVIENWSDNLSTSDGIKGTLSQGSSDLYNITESPSGTYTITLKSGSFAIGTTIDDLIYTPASNRDGDVTFDVSVENSESHTYTGHDSGTLTSAGSKTITVTPTVDTDTDAVVVSGTGIEDTTIEALTNPVKVNIELTGGEALLQDESESLGNIILDDIPDGFVVYYKIDGETLKMATNLGEEDGSSYDLNPYADGDKDNTAAADLISTNQWLIPTDGSLVPDIYINAPENWSGSFDFETSFTIGEENLTSVVSYAGIEGTATITAVADDITIDPTLTFGDAFDWVDLKLNANMEDVDGSETMSLQITGLDDMAQFQLADGTSLNATFSAGTDADSSTDADNVWTIEGITYDEINNIQFTQDTSVIGVSVEAWTVESTNSTLSSHTTAETFDLTLNEASGIITLGKGVNLDFDKLDNLANIDEIDLSITGENDISNLSLQDVLDITDGNNELKITGDSEDDVSLIDTTGWTEGTETDNGDNTSYGYSKGSDTVTLTVDDNISNTGL